MKTKKDFILETLMPYAKDPSTCGIDRNTERCLYIDHKTGNKCAFGRWLKNPEDAISIDSASTILTQKGEEVLVKEARGVFTKEEWNHIQGVHDSIAFNVIDKADKYVRLLEESTQVDLTELKEAISKLKKQKK